MCNDLWACDCVLAASRHPLTSMALTHMHRDLAASDTLPMISGWKSTCLQYWPIFFKTRSDILSLSKLTNVLMKLDSPVRNISRSHWSENKISFPNFSCIWLSGGLISKIKVIILKGKEVLFSCAFPKSLSLFCVIYFCDKSTALWSARGKRSAVFKGENIFYTT